MSGFTDQDAFRTHDPVAGTSFLQKPFSSQDLVERIEGLLAAREERLSADYLRILVIEDDQSVRDVLQSLLEGLGHDVRSAADGALGLEELARADYDVVISDMIMPNLDGILTCSEIRDRFPHVRVIAMSGYRGSRSYLSAAEKLGAVATLKKPFSQDELVLALEQALTAA
jgi:CheY-like chemotaxis protein